MSGRIICVVAAIMLAPHSSHVIAQSPEMSECNWNGLRAQCGVIEVAENRSNPEGRRLRLPLMVIRAATQSAAATPLFMVAGGPGAAASTLADLVAFDLNPLRRNRDLVFLAQRGTVGSSALRCTPRVDRFAVPDDTAGCVVKLSAGADLRFYGTDDFARDLEEARLALGYERIDLFGTSYGTRAAAWYAKRYPAWVRALVLLGPNPPTQRVFDTVTEDVDRAFVGLENACRADPSCATAYPSFSAELARVRAGLSWLRQQGVFLLAYSPTTARRLPWLMHEAARGNDVPLHEAIDSMISASQDQVALGLLLTVQCSEEVPFNRRPEPVTPLTELFDACRGWPRIPVPADLREPFRSKGRALIIAGALDPVTPPRWADEMATMFDENQVVIVPHGSHHFGTAGGCLGRAITAFLDNGAADFECVAALSPPPFYVPVTGAREP